MKRFQPWPLLPVIAAVWTVLAQSRAPALLKDQDTVTLLHALAVRHNPLSWFYGDWPLANHFYRPLPTLAFEFDLWFWKGDASGYGLTNSLIAAACILLTAWCLREVTGNKAVGCVGAAIFGLFHCAPTLPPAVASLGYAPAVLVWLGLLRGGRQKIPAVVVASFSWGYLVQAVPVSNGFAGTIIHWLPGRTASTMTVFCLIALACYARYERLTASYLAEPGPSPTDLPATKSTVIESAGKHPWSWIVGACLGIAGALASYEQAVMLPAVLLGFAILMRLLGRMPHWRVHLLFWGLLVGYAVFRHSVVPSGMSAYQAQQLRHGPGVLLSLSDYFAPAATGFPLMLGMLEFGLMMLFTQAFWGFVQGLLSNVAVYVATWKDRERWLTLFLMTAALVAFLPMAWQKTFSHYYYWPATLWCGYLVILARVVGRQTINAIAPLSLQAPPRQHPAPGSLLHR